MIYIVSAWATLPGQCMTGNEGKVEHNQRHGKIEQYWRRVASIDHGSLTAVRV